LTMAVESGQSDQSISLRCHRLRFVNRAASRVHRVCWHALILQMGIGLAEFDAC
jgi:hypothetical protein